MFCNTLGHVQDFKNECGEAGKTKVRFSHFIRLFKFLAISEAENGVK